MFNKQVDKPQTQNIISALAAFSVKCPELLSLAGLSGDLVNDSRLVATGDVFCAVIGHEQDGRSYIETAIEQGATLIIAECESETEHGEAYVSELDNHTCVIKFYQLNQQLFELAKHYYQAPQDKLSMIGITGTNGKTSTSQLVATMLSDANKPSAVIGTNGAGRLSNLIPIANTTPAASELHQFLYNFSADGITHVAMEVSSHALCQKRVTAQLFNIAVFTNLTRDHLDYHGSMAEYALAKKQLFTGEKTQVAVLNYDDPQVQQWLKQWPAEQQVWLYGKSAELLTKQYYLSASQISHHSHGVSFQLATHLGDVQIDSSLLGDFNIDNLLAAIAVLLIEGITLGEISSLVKKIQPVAGRMEAFNQSGSQLPTAVVDYAHTPDALEKALLACQQHCAGNVYVVFGCGGDRDKGKRALMAQAAQNHADYIVITNDNPRSEDAQAIANDILAGFDSDKCQQVKVILDREKAVLSTLQTAKRGDIVLLAGKGHEDYIIMADGKGGTRKVNYNERDLVANFYNQEHTETGS